MKLSIVGTQGIPNSYGGFETLAEYLVSYLSEDFEITVYCSSKDKKKALKTWKDAKLKYIPISSHGTWGILYDSLSLVHACFTSDKVLFLGFGGGFIIPFLKHFKSKIILNFGGLDWQRNKWSKKAQQAIKYAEKNLIKNSSIVISDNIGIQNYIKQEYNIDAPLIAYGGDQASKRPITGYFKEQYPFLSSPYAFSVTRIQKDNNIEMILEAFSHDTSIPLIMVGNWNSSVFGKLTKHKYAAKENLILLDAIYDQSILDVLRSNCTIYIHGHSAGGTNPSLCEAMFLSLPVIAFASGYNEYTTDNKALYFNNESELHTIINQIRSLDLTEIGYQLQKVAKEKYIWAKIAQQYKEIILK